MKLSIGTYDFSIIWDGVYYFALTNEKLTDWELSQIIHFVNYEEMYDRTVEFECDESLKIQIQDALKNKERFNNVAIPSKITQCTACKEKGCMTDFVCHTAPLEQALSILQSGSIKSSVKARNVSSEQLQLEPRNAAKDPLDYFLYAMFSWGNCQAGDRLVMERKFNRSPNESDLSIDFTPGIRFYFHYDHLIQHQNATFDGYHSIKIKDELKLFNNVFCIVIPMEYKEEIEDYIPLELKEYVHYLSYKNKDIWEWSNSVYEYIQSIK